MKTRIRRCLTPFTKKWVWGAFRTPESRRPFAMAMKLRSLIKKLER